MHLVPIISNFSMNVIVISLLYDLKVHTRNHLKSHIDEREIQTEAIHKLMTIWEITISVLD